jgi:hypothetical protein
MSAIELFVMSDELNAAADELVQLRKPQVAIDKTRAAAKAFEEAAMATVARNSQ